METKIITIHIQYVISIVIKVKCIFLKMNNLNVVFCSINPLRTRSINRCLIQVVTVSQGASVIAKLLLLTNRLSGRCELSYMRRCVEKGCNPKILILSN